MTPKEKAEELVNKYRNSIMSFLSDNMKDQNAKQCALIAVNEMLEELDHLAFDDFDYGTSKMMYWQEVKEEIKKL
jgi:hypothetical protein